MTESLIMAGAFDSLHDGRCEMLSSLSEAMERAAEIKRHNVTGQLDLFSNGENSALLSIQFNNVGKETLAERLDMEKKVAGVYLSGHPLDEYRRVLSECVRIEDIKNSLDSGSGEFREKQRVQVLGNMTSKKVMTTKNGEIMAFITMSDISSFAEVVLFPRVFDSCEKILEPENVLLVKCEISTRSDELKLLAQSVEIAPRDTEFVRKNVPTTLYLRVGTQNDPVLSQALDLLRKKSGKTDVVIYYRDIKKSFRVSGLYTEADRETLNDLVAFLGRENVVLKEKK
jgi:DNA polymerase-3 subunit alpha